MNQNELFDAAQSEITEFRAMLEKHLGDRDSKTLDAIKRNDAWNDLAQYAQADAANPDLSDLATEFEDFSEAMQDASDAYA